MAARFVELEDGQKVGDRTVAGYVAIAHVRFAIRDPNPEGSPSSSPAMIYLYASGSLETPKDYLGMINEVDWIAASDIYGVHS